MEILKLCAGIVITVLVSVGIGSISAFISWMTDVINAWPFLALRSHLLKEDIYHERDVH